MFQHNNRYQMTRNVSWKEDTRSPKDCIIKQWSHKERLWNQDLLKTILTLQQTINEIEILEIHIFIICLGSDAIQNNLFYI